MPEISTTVTESTAMNPSPPVMLRGVGGTMASRTTLTKKEEPPQAVKTTEPVVETLGAPGSIVSDPQAGDGNLESVVGSAKAPCVIVCRNEGDANRVRRLVDDKDGLYSIRINPKQDVRVLWRAQK